MAPSVADRPVRTPPKSLRSALDVPRPSQARIRPDSDPVRLDPKLSDKTAFLALVDEARIRAGLKKEVMALNAGVPFSQFSEALSGTRGNFAIHWLHRQPPEFWLAFHKITTLQYGLSPAAAHDIYADQIGHLVALLLKHRGVA